MHRYLLLSLLSLLLLSACNKDEQYSLSKSDRLTFSLDTVRLDTVFAGMGSSTKTFWVYNRGDRGLHLSSVRLVHGSSSGFRVNVDGSYLDNAHGSLVRDLELRHGDSLRVFVEVTPDVSGQIEPQALADQLVFTLESGTTQQVQLEAWGWDAVVMRDVTVGRDSVIDSPRPVVIYGGLRVDSGATLTLRHTTLYFHDRAGIDVYGRLLAEGSADVPVVLRGDRLDRMFDYLPYNNVSGQWRGVHFFGPSTGNVMRHTQIVSACDAVVVDSAAVDSLMPRLTMQHCVVHNARGAGVQAQNANISLAYCQLTNTLGHCLAVMGGRADVEHCTLAQFYPFAAERGAALYIANTYDRELPPDSLHPTATTVSVTSPLTYFFCRESILTGYADDVLMGQAAEDTSVVFSYMFYHSLLRTPRVETADSVAYVDVMWEAPGDSIQGKKHFRLVDEDNLVYDFRLDSLSTAHGLGCYVDTLAAGQ